MKNLLLVLSVSSLTVWQASASLDGSTANYNLYDGGSYNGSAPVLGTYNSTGTATWTPSTQYSGVSALTPGGNEAGPGYDAWYPLGYKNFSASVTTSFVAPINNDNYTFGLFSDDGSILKIDGVVIVNDGGEHGPTALFNTIALTAGVHQMEVTYFEGYPLSQANLTAYADTKLVPVPEPSTYLAGFGALSMLGMFAWRNRK